MPAASAGRRPESTAAERREARAPPKGAPRLSGRGFVWCAFSALRSPRFKGGKSLAPAEAGVGPAQAKQTTARPRRKEQGKRSVG